MTVTSDPLKEYVGALRNSHVTGTCLPAECYRDPVCFDLELEHVLRPGWHAVARWDDLPEPGDYAAIDVWGEPLVLVRDESRALRVFSRICRHRAHAVVEGCGNARKLVCPYHRWTYGLDGRLQSAPLMRETPGFDPDRCGLAEVRTESWQGFLMASLDPDPAPFAGEVGSLDERLASCRFADLATVHVHEFESPWNWKVMVDNFMESYHHLGAHMNTLQTTNPASGTFASDIEGAAATLENPGIGDASSFLVWHAFPTLLAFVDEHSMFGGWYEMQIDSHERFLLRIHVMATPALATDEDAVKGLAEFTRQIHLEDIPVCESVQRGIASRLWEPGPLSKLEGCLTRFHRYLEGKLALAV